VTEGTLRVTWVGHATVLVEMDGVRVLTDPVVRARLVHLRRHAPPVAPEAVADIDAVLISHLHSDHLDMPSLRRLPHSARLIGPRGSGRILRRLGCASVTELAPGQRVTVGDVGVTAVPATHDGRRWPLGRAAGAVGFVLDGSRCVYFAGDTDLYEGMAEAVGAVDVALLPVWGWGPSLGEGHMDPVTAAHAAALLMPRVVVPIHWGTLYPAGLARFRPDPLNDPPREFETHCATLAPEVDVRVLSPGESTTLA
jgi:L-ascorbate metabolism protein UlaG (beta-lactamase superfamily)